jgi:hypothetical protein
MKKITLFLAYWRSLRLAREPRWTQADRQALEAFIASPAGQRLAQLLRHLVIRQQHAAVMSGAGNGWHCGRAAGFALAIAVLDGLAAGQISEGGETEPQTEENLYEHLSP